MQLGALEHEKRLKRIKRLEAWFRGDPRLGWNGEQEAMAHAGDALYQARYNGRRYDEVPSAQEVLDAFCFAMFKGCDFEEVMMVGGN